MLALCHHLLVVKRKFISLRILPILLFSLIELNAIGQNEDKTGANYLRMNEVNSHAARHFLINFPKVNTIGWTKETDIYIASFQTGSSRAKAYYDNNGNFICCMKYCLVEELDRNLKAAIIAKFPECKILTVTQFTSLENQAYFVNIKCGEDIKTLCCNEDGIKITESFKDVGL